MMAHQTHPHPSEQERLLLNARYLALENESISYGSVEHIFQQKEKLDISTTNVNETATLTQTIKTYIERIKTASQQRVVVLWIVMLVLFLANIFVFIRLCLHHGNLF
jgi:hypothetical protein